MCFDPKEQVGAIALVNGDADAAALSMDLGAIARDEVRASAPAIEPPPRMPEAYEAFLGIYLDRESGALVRLEWRDGRLAFVDPNNPAWRPILAPTGNPDVFIVEPGARESREPAVFRRVPDGRVAAVCLAAWTLIRLDAVR